MPCLSFYDQWTTDKFSIGLLLLSLSLTRHIQYKALVHILYIVSHMEMVAFSNGYQLIENRLIFISTVLQEQTFVRDVGSYIITVEQLLKLSCMY